MTAQQARTARMCAFYKAYSGERKGKDTRDWLQAPYYQCKLDHCWKIRSRKIRQILGNSPL
jgi:hypothetical protein